MRRLANTRSWLLLATLVFGLALLRQTVLAAPPETPKAVSTGRLEKAIFNQVLDEFRLAYAGRSDILSTLDRIETRIDWTDPSVNASATVRGEVVLNIGLLPFLLISARVGAAQASPARQFYDQRQVLRKLVDVDFLNWQNPTLNTYISKFSYDYEGLEVAAPAAQSQIKAMTDLFTAYFYKSALIFIIGHEIAHHLLCHVGARARLACLLKPDSTDPLQDERDADEWAHNSLAKLGYSSAAAAVGLRGFLYAEKALQGWRKGAGRPSIVSSTHPSWDDRLKRFNQRDNSLAAFVPRSFADRVQSDRSIWLIVWPTDDGNRDLKVLSLPHRHRCGADNLHMVPSAVGAYGGLIKGFTDTKLAVEMACHDSAQGHRRYATWEIRTPGGPGPMVFSIYSLRTPNSWTSAVDVIVSNGPNAKPHGTAVVAGLRVPFSMMASGFEAPQKIHKAIEASRAVLGIQSLLEAGLPPARAAAFQQVFEDCFLSFDSIRARAIYSPRPRNILYPPELMSELGAEKSEARCKARQRTAAGEGFYDLAFASKMSALLTLDHMTQDAVKTSIDEQDLISNWLGQITKESNTAPPSQDQ